MAARRRSHNTRDLPPNLYVRNDGYYSFRDPRTGKEYGLGRDKRYAVNEAIAANMELAPARGNSLIDRIVNKNIITFDVLIDAFWADVSTRNLSPKTLADHKSKLRGITSYFSHMNIESIDTRVICSFLDSKISEGKRAMANNLRTTLSDIFKTAIAKGLTTYNPVNDTRNVKNQVSKERLTLEEYLKIREAADSMHKWVGLSFDLAIVTGQREGDLARLKWDDINDEKLCIIQGKTKSMVRISLANHIEELNLKLSSTLDALKDINSGSELILDGITAKRLSEAFRVARNKSGLEWKKKPPPFHELRSLAGRLYARQNGKDFAQNILGHKSSAMTELYTDGRGKEWTDV